MWLCVKVDICLQEAISSDPAASVSVVMEMVKDGHVSARAAVQMAQAIVSQIVANARADLSRAVLNPYVSL